MDIRRQPPEYLRNMYLQLPQCQIMQFLNNKEHFSKEDMQMPIGV